MHYFSKIGSWVCISACGYLCNVAHAKLPTDITTSEDPKANLTRLITTLRQLEGRDVPSDLRDVMSKFDAATNEQQIRNSLRTLLPEISRHQALRERAGLRRRPHWTANHNRVENGRPTTTISNLDWLTNTSTSYPPTTDLWLQGWNDSGSQDDEDGFDGFDSSSSGITFGVGYSRANATGSFSLGASIGTYIGDVASSDFGQDDTDADEYSFSLVYSKGNHSFDASIGRAETAAARDRVVRIDTDKDHRQFTLHSDFDTIQNAYSVGYSWYRAKGDLAFVPYISATYATTETDDYVESGGALGLSVQTADEAQLLGAIGSSMAWVSFSGNWAISPSVTLAFEHDFRADPTTTVSHFSGTATSFTTTGIDVEDSRWRYSFGLQMMHTSSFSIGFSYDGQRKDNYRYDAAVIAVQIEI